MEYPVVSHEVRRQLERITPSFDGVCEYRPCRVRLGSGRMRDFVYVVEAEPYMRAWGVWPEDDEAKVSIAMGDVVEVQESPNRLPVELANKLYDAGESAMGSTVFTAVLRDGRRLTYATGNAVDFPSLPPGVEGGDIVDVVLGEGGDTFRDRRPAARETSAPYAWCLYRPEAD
jgi:hypothetical protein